MRTSLSVACAMAMFSASVMAADVPMSDQVPSPTLAAGSRSFTFVYSATVNGLAAGSPTRVWLPVPTNDQAQQVRQLRSDVPANASLEVEPRFGNRILSFELPKDHGPSASFSITYDVTRKEVGSPLLQCPVPAEALMSNAAALLQPDSHVPVGGVPADTLLAGKTIPVDTDQQARLLYDVVDDHLQYRKDKPGWGTGDATWACHSGFGNCTDFHSLFISLARTEKLPSVFQIGFPVPEVPGKVAGYHCWAWVKLSAGWSPVDISEANLHPAKRDYYFGHLDANRVAFTTGRDLDLVPKQAGPPLNFFVYPYVEEAGKAVPQEQIAKAMKCETPQ